MASAWLVTRWQQGADRPDYLAAPCPWLPESWSFERAIYFASEEDARVVLALAPDAERGEMHLLSCREGDLFLGEIWVCGRNHAPSRSQAMASAQADS